MTLPPIRRAGRIGLAVVIALCGAEVLAEAPDTALRPPVRVIEPPGRPLARPEPAVEQAAGAVTEPAAPSDDMPAPEDTDPDASDAVEGPPAEAPPPAPRAPDLSQSLPSALPGDELTVSDQAAFRWPPEAPARPEIRLQARPEVRIASGPPPGRPVARPPLPPRPFYFDEVWTPRIYGAATLPPRPEISPEAVALALRPPERPEGITRAAEAARVARQRGAVCGNPAIQGDVLGSVPGPGSCGIDGAVRVRSVAGIPLSMPSRMDCRTARALHRWVVEGAVPAVGNTGGGLREIRVIGEYSCRTRNNAPGARLSEHAFGRAIDIAGFTLADGNRVSLLRHWRSGTYGRMLINMHRSACGIFGTVLGPNANAAHRDHFHFDTARYRSGAYCR